MPKLQPMQSLYFSINGKTFMCIGTYGTDERDDCIDTIKDLATGKLHHVKRSHTMSQNVTWITKEQYEHIQIQAMHKR